VKAALVALALAGALSLISAARAQEPTPYPTPYGLVTVPVTITVDGPVQAYAGGQVTFTIDYAFSAPNPLGNQYKVGFTHILNPGTRYVSSEMESGDGECWVAEQKPGVQYWVDCEVGSDAARSGRLAVTLDIDADFVGPLSYGVYMRGTSIRFEPGSVETFTTEVVAPETAPQTESDPNLTYDLPDAGGGYSDGASGPLLPVALAVAGVLLVSGSAFAVARVIREGRD
jgi:hypothetical protein